MRDVAVGSKFAEHVIDVTLAHKLKSITVMANNPLSPRSSRKAMFVKDTLVSSMTNLRMVKWLDWLLVEQGGLGSMLALSR